MWEQITVALADLGPVELDAVGDDDATPSPSSSFSEQQQQRASSSGKAGGSGSGSGSSGGEDEALVEYDGMLVSVAAAQRRRFFSSLIQRAAKMHRRLRGGSLTLLLAVPGLPARGLRGAGGALGARAADAASPADTVAKYRHLSEEQKAKLLLALEQRAACPAGASIDDGGAGAAEEEGVGAGAAAAQLPPARELRTEVVEELMSIADGQVVLCGRRDPPTGGMVVDPALSVSRIGSRAYCPAMEALAPAVRLELAQAADAERFAARRDRDPAAARAARRAAVIAAALPQPPRTTVRLEDQVVQLLALQRGFLDDVPPPQVAAKLAQLTASVRQLAPAAVQEVAATGRLTAAAEAALVEALQRSSEALILRP